jgi:coenzyme PQQ precursor peptide PqqA
VECARFHENHEARFMISAPRLGGPRVQDGHGCLRAPRSRRPALRHFIRRLRMKWETPTAVDFRFGFEITMYVSAR